MGEPKNDEGMERVSRALHARGASRSVVARLAVTGLVLAASVLPALAQDPAADAAADTARLRSCLFYVERVKGADRAWAPFVKNAGETVARYAQGEDEGTVPTPLRAARDDIFWARATALLLGGPAGMEAAYSLLDVLDENAVDEERRNQANVKCYDIHMTWGGIAEKADDENTALENYYAAAKRRPEMEAPWSNVGALSRKKAAADVKAQRFNAGLEALRSAKTGLEENAPASAGGAIGDIQSDIDRILATTGEVRVAWLGRPEALDKVPGGRNDLRKARLKLAARDGGVEPPEQSIDAGMRVRTGEFDVVATGSSGAALAVPGGLSVSRDGAEVVLPTAIPDGMLYVPAGEGLDAFLIDRTEVSVAEFKPFAARTNAQFVTDYGDDTAVSGVSFQDAVAFAASIGKKLPTRDQWVYACFGSIDAAWDSAGAAPRYPWGNGAGEPGVHGYFAGVTEGPGPAAGCEAGASLFSGCLNMAFNVWEWLDDAWAIGGAFNVSEAQRTVNAESGEWVADMLRTAAPSPEAYDKLNNAQQDKYGPYRVRRSTLKRVGLRCVLTLGTPWRE